MKKMKLILGSVAILCGAISVGAFAGEPPKEVGSLRRMTIIDITSIKKVSEYIDTSAKQSTMDVEFEGTYEGNAALDNLVGLIETQSSSDTSFKGELKLYSADLKPVAMRAGTLATSGIASPTPFRLTVKVTPSVWSPTGNVNFDGPQTGFEWNVVARVRKHMPVEYDHSYGFSAYLIHSASRKAWEFYPSGLKSVLFP